MTFPPRTLALAVAATLTAGGSRSAGPAPVAARSEQRELVAVFIGSAGTDSASGMRDVLPQMRRSLGRVASASSRFVFTKGVSIEPDIDAGIADLASLGGFDEISVGGNWTNSGVVEYLMRHPGRLAIPQVIVLERTVTKEDRSVVVSPERELARYVGTNEIADWVKRGTPVP